MNKNQAMLSKQTPEVLCMLLPLMDDILLVPTVSVAEMANLRPFDNVENTPEWFFGFYTWRGLSVPVVGYETLNGGGLPLLNTEGRVAVLNCADDNPDMPFIGIITQNIPRIARVEEPDIVSDATSSVNTFDLMAVKIGSEMYKIPDVVTIKNAYLALGIQAPGALFGA